MYPARSNNCGKAIIISEYRAAIAISAKRFGRKKTGAGDVGELANGPTVKAGAKTLRSVIDQPQSMRVSKCSNGSVISWLTKKTNADNSNNLDARQPGQLPGHHPAFLGQG